MQRLNYLALTASVFVVPVILITSQSAIALTTKQASASITVSGITYDVFFNKNTQSSTTFNDVYGTGSPSLTFTTQADATAARDAIVANIPAADFDPFGLPSSGFAGFFVPFIYSATGFNRVGANYLIPNGPVTPLGAAANNDAFSRTQAYNFSFVTFQRAAAVPTPALLPGLIGFGVAAIRKRKEA
jgi:hypothetical protein